MADNETVNEQIDNSDTKIFVDKLGIEYKPIKNIDIKKPKSKNKDDKEKELPITYTRSVSRDNLIAETIKLDNKNTFLIYQPKADMKNKWTVSNQVLKGNVIYLPEPDSPYAPYTFTKTEIENLGKNEICIQSDLYNEILYTIKDFIDLPNESLSLIANTILLSYEQQKFNRLGYLAILGIPSSGKSTVGEIIAFIGYRVFMSIGINASNVYDFIGTNSESDCVIVVDEIQEHKDDMELLSILRSGYKKGAYVRRITDPSSSKRDRRYYKTYCLKILLGQYLPPHDNALSERCIITNMIKGQPIKDEYTETDVKKFVELKKKLLLYRMFHYFDPLPEIELSIRNRVKEIWKAQLIVANNTDAKENIDKLLVEYLQDMENNEKTSIDRMLVTCILKLTDLMDTLTLKNDTIWESLVLTLCKDKNVLKYQEINNFQYDGNNVSKWIIGKKLSPVLGGKGDSQYFSELGTTVRVWKFEKKTLNQLEKSFKITDAEKNMFISKPIIVEPPPAPTDQPLRSVPMTPASSQENTLANLFSK